MWKNTQSIFDKMLEDTFDDVFYANKGYHVEKVDGEGVKLYIDLPGVKKSDIQVDVTGNLMSVRAERRGFVKSTYARSFTIASSVRTEDLIAEFTDGVLTVLIPNDTKSARKTLKIR